MTLDLAHWRSPIGELTLAMEGERLAALAFTDSWERVAAHLARHGRPVPPDASISAPPAALAERLAAYCDGAIDALDALPTDPAGTEFQRRVWAALKRVPPGRTITYGELARAAGAPGAARAAGAAAAANPIWLVIPCHRAVGAGGRLSGYAGGPGRKRWLLAHEQRWCTGAAGVPG